MRIEEALTISALEEVPGQRITLGEHGPGVSNPSEGTASTTNASLIFVELSSGLSKRTEEVCSAFQ